MRRPLSIAVIRTAEGWHVQRGGEAFLIEAELPSAAALLVRQCCIRSDSSLRARLRR